MKLGWPCGPQGLGLWGTSSGTAPGASSTKPGSGHTGTWPGNGHTVTKPGSGHTSPGPAVVTLSPGPAAVTRHLARQRSHCHLAWVASRVMGHVLPDSPRGPLSTKPGSSHIVTKPGSVTRHLPWVASPAAPAQGTQ